jgi:hypothetical protein
MTTLLVVKIYGFGGVGQVLRFDLWFGCPRKKGGNDTWSSTVSMISFKLLAKVQTRLRKLNNDIVMQETLKVEAKDNGRHSRLAFSGIAVAVDEGSLERRDSMNSVSSVSSASSRSSIIRRLSWGDSSEYLQNIVVCFDDQKRKSLNQRGQVLKDSAELLTILKPL